MNALWPVFRLQQADLKVMELEAQLAALTLDPATAAVVEETRHKLTQAEEAARKSSAALKALEYELSAKETEKKKQEQQLYSGKVNNSKELGALQKDIELLGAQKGQLEEQVLGLMDAVEEQKGYAGQLKYLLAEQEQALQERSASLQGEQQQVQATLREWRDKRQALVPAVEPNLLRKYDHLRRKDGIAVARAVRGTTCSSCGMALPPQSRSKLQDGQLETCKNCGRLLLAEGEMVPGQA